MAQRRGPSSGALEGTIAMVGDQRAREIERPPPRAKHDLHKVGVRRIVARALERRGDGGNIGPRRGHEEFDCSVDRFGLDLRLIALDVDHDIRLELLGNLCQATGAIGMIGSGQDRHAACCLDRCDDALVVRRDDDRIERARLSRLLKNMDHQRPTRGSSEDLLGKSARSESCRDDTDTAESPRSHAHVGISFMSKSISFRLARMSR